MFIAWLLAHAWFTFGPNRTERQIAETKAATERGKSSKEPVEELIGTLRQANASEISADAAVWQLLISLLGLAGVGAGIFYAQRAWREAKRSADTAIDAQRPWLLVQNVEIDSVKMGPQALFDETALRIPIKFAISNVGNSPALYVKPAVMAVSGFAAADERLAEFVNRLSTPDYRRPGGTSVFPNTSAPFDSILTIRKGDLGQVYQFGADFAFINVIIFGAIAYYYPATRTHHYTSFKFILKTNPDPFTPSFEYDPRPETQVIERDRLIWPTQPGMDKST